MWPATWRTAVGSVMSVGLSQGMSVAAANMLTAAEAAGVQIALRIMQIISQISQAPFYTRIPQFNRAQAASVSTHLTRSEEHTSELQSLMRISYAVFCLK